MTNPVTITPIYPGTSPNDGTGDPIRVAFIKCNDNFANLNVFGNTIINGNSSVTIPSANGNVLVSVANISNVAVFSTTGLTVANAFNTGTITTSGNLTVGSGATIDGDLIVYGNITGPGNINVISGNSGQFFGNGSSGFGALYAGLAVGYANVPQTVLQLASNYNGYSQLTHQNINSGAAATTDYVATADNGNETTNYVNLGVASSTFAGVANNSLGTSLLPNDSFLYAQGNLSSTPGGNLVIGTTTSGRVVKIISGGANSQNIVATFNAPSTVSNSTTTGAVTILGGLGVYGNVNSNTVTTTTVTATNIGGTLTTAAQPNITSLGTLTGLTTSGAIIAATVNAAQIGNTGATITGATVTATNIGGTLTTAAQPNITSVGTLTGLTTSGTIVAATVNAATIGNAGAIINAATVNAAQIGNSGSLISGTLTTAAQPNITSVGTLTGLTVSGTINAGNINANVTGTITNAINVSGNAQPNITSVGTLSSLSVTTSVSAGSFIGNGGLLTNLPGAQVTGTVANATYATSAGSITGQQNSATIAAVVAATPATIALRDGSGSLTATNFNGQASTALYADLAENYLADQAYAPGTVVSFGGDAEVTISLTDADPLVIGVVSTDPAYLMNSGLTGNTVVPVAFTGRIPCQVRGPITRGAMLVSDGTGRARAEPTPSIGTVIGKALESFEGDVGVIEIVVGKL